MIEYGQKRFNLVLQPISGKALPVYKGEVLRIIQVEGEQCVDFNAYNLNDYKEYMDVSACRRSTSFHPKKGDVIFSNPPRYHPMIGIIEMPPTCVADVLGRSCHAMLYESRYGLMSHTNCVDTFSECIAEYGLTPDDVHHSLNMWMNTEWDSSGNWWVNANTGIKGDYVDLLALMDILAVPIVCGSGDVMLTSNFSFKPIEIQVFGVSEDSQRLVARIEDTAGRFYHQRSVENFHAKQIKSERELKPVPEFKPNFINYPIKVDSIIIEISEQEYSILETLVSKGFGKDPGVALRRAVMTWYNRHIAKPDDWARIPTDWL